MICVLVTCVGSTGAQGVLKALRNQTRYPVHVIGADAQERVAGRYLVDEFYRIPLPSSKEYLQTLLNLATKSKVRLLVPIMEPEMEVLSQMWPREHSCRIVCSDYETVACCNNKLQLTRFLMHHGFSTPCVFEHAAISYPAVLKPVCGGGSKETHRLDNEEDLTYYLARIRTKSFVQQWIDGEEYSVDTFSDLNGNFVGAVPRLRLEVKGGLATKTVTVTRPRLLDDAERLARAFRFRGPANLQCISRDDKYYFFDINPRFGGACVAAITAGLNGPLFLLNEIADEPINYNGYLQNLTMLRYWDEVYVGEDDHLL